MWVKRKKTETAKTVDAVVDTTAVNNASPVEVKTEGSEIQSPPVEIAQEPETPVTQAPEQPEGVIVPLDSTPSVPEPIEESVGVRKIVVRMGSSKLEINNIHILKMDINNSILTIDITESHE